MSNWTIATAFFNLKKHKDANNACRPFEFYIANAKFTIGLNNNLVIFCDEDTYKPIYDMRASFKLLDKTRFIKIRFEDLPLYRYYDKIVENRKTVQWYNGHRNTPSFFIFLGSKFYMMEQVINFNPFSSTHFAWIDFGISHAVISSQELINEIFSVNRDKVSFCMFSYQHANLATNMKEFYTSEYRYGVCGGAFTANKHYMTQLIDLCHKEFVDTIQQGYGHTDEFVILTLYMKHKDIFELYYGDYEAIFTNYIHIKRQEHAILHNIIKYCRINNNLELSRIICSKILYSHDKKYITLTPQDYICLLDEYFIAAWYTKQDDCKLIMERLASLSTDPTYHIFITQMKDQLFMHAYFASMLYYPEKSILISTSVEEAERLVTQGNIVILKLKGISITSKSFPPHNPMVVPL